MAHLSPDSVTEPDRDIATLEARIERLANTVERCRKISVGARVLAYGGSAALVLMLLPVLPMTAPMLLGAITAAIAGAVLSGSNRATREEAEAQLRVLENERNTFIDALALRRIAERPTLH